MDTRNATEELEIAGTWRPQRVIMAAVDEHLPFVVLLTFKDGYRARISLRDDSADNLGVVLRDPQAFRELHVDDELGTISWPNGFDYDPDSLRMLAMEQHPGDPAAIPLPLQ
ncbi:MAG: DUF2442 domain-containing protein [Chloroflexota bacterium]|nr:DUF2442 domain-containing protein [Chloroflexota bacterium]MDQ6907239.1 DUF2442 domain-containing protein [Chloroflexota bacterium]